MVLVSIEYNCPTLSNCWVASALANFNIEETRIILGTPAMKMKVESMSF